MEVISDDDTCFTVVFAEHLLPGSSRVFLQCCCPLAHLSTSSSHHACHSAPCPSLLLSLPIPAL